MTHQAPPTPACSGADSARQLAQLRELLRLIERIAGHQASGPDDDDLDRAARLSDAYDRALPIVQRRFDALAAEAAAWAAAGVEALLVTGEQAPPKAAAARLAERLRRALSEMTALVR